MRSQPIDIVALKQALVRKGWSQAQLAQALRCPATTLSSWLRADHPCPAELQVRIEQALGLPKGALSTPADRAANP
jgi:transcriptional regulator with XRE-family HTH domain